MIQKLFSWMIIFPTFGLLLILRAIAKGNKKYAGAWRDIMKAVVGVMIMCAYAMWFMLPWCATCGVACYTPYCAECGVENTAVEDNAIPCEFCGAMVKEDTNYCPYCGVDVVMNEPQEEA